MTETVTGTTVEDAGPDPDTLEPRITVTTHLTSIARVKYMPARIVDRETGNQYVGVEQVEIDFPSGTTVDPDWTLTVTASLSDGGLIGRTYRAKSAGAAGQTTALRVPVEEVS